MSTIRTLGVPAETKSDEHRVSLTPDGVVELAARGVEVRVQSGAGSGAGFDDTSYEEVGAVIVGSVRCV